MFPIILDFKAVKILLVGNGPATARRKELFAAAGYKPKHIKKIPAAKDVKDAEIIFVADFDEKTSKKIYTMGKKAGALVNVEDKKNLCDFHVPAIVRRGNLLLTVSTNAKSPRLARLLRQWLEKTFPAVWEKRVEEIGRARMKWKKEGADVPLLAQKTDEFLNKKGWLKNL